MLRGKNIYLRLIENKDIFMLKKICNEDKVKQYNLLREEKDLRSIKGLSIINEKNVLVGFLTYKKTNDKDNIYMIGITIGSRFWDRGYGKDSISLIISYLFNELKAARVELEVIKSNLRAINCYKRCGFKENKTKIYYKGKKYIETLMMFANNI